VLAENGYPVRFIVPDPRVFALHKIWLSVQPTRDPVKRKRDYHQGEAIGRLAMDYLNLSFNDATIAKLPHELIAMKKALVDRLRSRRPPSRNKSNALPPGFNVFDEKPS